MELNEIEWKFNSMKWNGNATYASMELHSHILHGMVQLHNYKIRYYISHLVITLFHAT